MSATFDRRIWSRDTIDPPANWRRQIPQACLALIDPCRTQSSISDRSAWLRELPSSFVEAMRSELEPVRKELEQGRGFVILTGLEESWSAKDMEFAYWNLGCGLGTPVAQNVSGVLLYDVRDTGQDVRRGARFSVTNAESSFHTDNSFGEQVADYVGLLCLQPAKAGGLSQMVNGFRVIEELSKRAPEDLAQLQQEFHFDRRGGIGPGEEPTAIFPVLTRNRGAWVCRYLRYWIEAGHEKASQPLTVMQVRALDALDEVLRMPELRVEFELRKGDMYFLNNRWIFHNRTAFEDFAAPERRRHLVRLWLQK
jgi:alpha-ketoglutarate-dependent taurine dioxygenase